MTRRKLFPKLLLFICIFAFLHMGVSKIYFETVLSHSNIAEVDREFQGIKEDISILILGDSHPNYAVDPRMINEHTYNLSSPGENHFQTYYKLRYLVEEENLDLDLVILSADLHTFTWFKTQRFIENYYWKKYINYIELGIFKDDLPTYLGYWVQGEFSYLGGLDETLEYVENIPTRQPLAYGFFLRENEGVLARKEISKQLSQAQNRANNHFLGYEALNDDLVTYYIKILDLCQKYDIPVVLVRYPVSSDYYSFASEIISFPQMYAELDSILYANGHQPPILDYHDLFWGQNEYFVNPTHLTLEGADIFTQLLAKDLESLALIP